jgi:hypothetical protein
MLLAPQFVRADPPPPPPPVPVQSVTGTLVRSSQLTPNLELQLDYKVVLSNFPANTNCDVKIQVWSIDNNGQDKKEYVRVTKNGNTNASGSLELGMYEKIITNPFTADEFPANDYGTAANILNRFNSRKFELRWKVVRNGAADITGTQVLGAATATGN